MLFQFSFPFWTSGLMSLHFLSSVFLPLSRYFTCFFFFFLEGIYLYIYTERNEMLFFSFETIGFGSVSRPLPFCHFSHLLLPTPCLTYCPFLSALCTSFFIAVFPCSHNFPVFALVFYFPPFHSVHFENCTFILTIAPHLVHFMFDKEKSSLLSLICQYIASNLLQKQWLLLFPPELSSFIHLLCRSSSPAC